LRNAGEIRGVRDQPHPVAKLEHEIRACQQIGVSAAHMRDDRGVLARQTEFT